LKYVAAEIKADEESYIRDVYITVCLRHAVNNIAAGLGGATISKDYHEIIKPKKLEAENRTPDEIYSGIKQRLEEMGH